MQETRITNKHESDLLAIELMKAFESLKSLKLRDELVKMYRDNTVRSIKRQLSSLATWDEERDGGT